MGWLIGILVALLLVAALAGPGRCNVCNLPIKRKYYTWKLDGRKNKLCPKCNSQMERKVSREAFKSKYGT